MQFQEKSLPFTFFLSKRPLLQNCIMHSSICTNGYFLSYYIEIHAWNAAGETCFVSKRYDLPGRASLTARLLWPVYFSHVWPKTLQLLLDGQDDKQIYIIFFLIYKLPTKKLKSWTFTKRVWEGRWWWRRINKKQSWTIEAWWWWWLLALFFFWFQVCFFFMFFPAS